MLKQSIYSLLFLAAIFLLEFNLDVREMGWAANLNALLIVLGGTVCATLLAYPLARLVLTLRILKKSFAGGEQEMASTIQTIVNLARINRTRNIRSLENQIGPLPQGLLRTGLELIVYHYSRENVEQILHREALSISSQHATAHKILHSMARLAPALGLAGTIVSLIRIFGHIQDPQNLIGYMAVALLCTFYGVILANLCFVPLSSKLKDFMNQDELRMEMIQEGILGLYDDEHPRAVQYRLETLAGTKVKPLTGQPRLVLMPSSAEKAGGTH